MSAGVQEPSTVAKSFSGIKPDPRGTKEQQGAYNSRKGVLTHKQLAFVNAYIIDRSPKKAAIAAGVPEKQASSVGSQWLDAVRFPLVTAEIKKRLQIIEDQAILEAADIRQRIHTVINFSLIDWFEPDEDGWWTATLEQMRALPQHIRRLITEVEIQKVSIEQPDGTVIDRKKVRCRTMSKDKALDLASKYGLIERHEHQVNVTTVNWDELYDRGQNVTDEVEERIKSAGLPAGTEIVNGNVKRPEADGGTQGQAVLSDHRGQEARPG